MVKVTIGGSEHSIPTPYNFRRIKLSWPHMDRAANAASVGASAIDGLDSMVALIAIGLVTLASHDDAEFEEKNAKAISAKIGEIEDKMLGTEIAGMQAAVLEIMKESGLIRQKSDGSIVGNEDKVPESPSTETGTASSQSLLQQGAEAATGT